ncbi:hypothetical protein [Pedobacter punctiformis]|uniref:DUF3568 domain-containing protein n=1 Tax=Pedobacter punctiformis TaxID=3004097 RepID=A0ABT4LC58_9SPHI|nr:hypothetical protein [Pedobacter sp. HCMS5-2]MCZ4245297.1 hypothetical protein [Pedobacter sp. HCMS5-2]
MKYLIYIISILLFTMGYGCKNRNNNLNITITDTNDSYNFKAAYPENKTEILEKYLDSALNNKLDLDSDLDLIVAIKNGEKINLKASSGKLEINFNKSGSTATGYMQVKRIAEEANKLLTKE